MTGDDPDQLGLFVGGADPRPVSFDALDALAARIPANVRFGTSSYIFEGWQGYVYHRRYKSRADFLRGTLEEYVRFPLFRTLGIDRGYYAPIPEDELLRYARTMPPSFVPTAKVWADVTAPWFPKQPRFGDRGGQRNPRFLDPELFEEAVGAPFARAFGSRRVPFVLEIPPSPLTETELLPALERFFDALRDRHRFAVELRNVELLTPRYLDLLHAHGASHVFNLWERMPTIGAQHRVVGPLPGATLVMRLLLPPGTTYEAQKAAFEPFDRLVDPQPVMRDDVVRLIRDATESGHEVFVIVGNKAEGSAPRTVEALVRHLVLG